VGPVLDGRLAGRARTWITGVLAFLASIVEAFTGYLSQQNLDAQWIATNGNDAFNAAAIGAFFNLMNLGHMLLWHVVLLPLVLVGIVGLHIVLVQGRSRRLSTDGPSRWRAPCSNACWRARPSRAVIR
jgi:quinol-cytochrome oxidoreductase complex cytochrome b subunit